LTNMVDGLEKNPFQGRHSRSLPSNIRLWSQYFMTEKFLVLFAVLVLSVNLAYAVERNKASASPPPLFKDPTTGIEMVYVKGGCYQMGDIFYEEKNEEMGFDRSEERPVHEVCVDDFYLGKYEVTQGQWKAIMGSNTAELSTCKEDNCPVDNVSWGDAQDFIGRLNSRSGGSRYRLPTEAEWEYAARSGGKRERYAGGNDVDSVARYNNNSEYKEGSGYKHYPVGTKGPNGLGIYDMSGNVWEMTSDWYDGHYYSSSPRNNPAGPSSGPGRTLRGGCTGGSADNQRTARRKSNSEYAVDRKDSIGFRLLRNCWKEAKGLCEP
jgi:sulfatase modifying factor 1